MITLRPPKPEDADALYSLLAGTDVVATLLWDGPSSLDSYRDTWRATVEAVVRGERHTFVIVEDPTGAAIGTASVRPMEGLGAPPPFRADIGMWIGVPYQGRGFGTTVIGKLVDYAFNVLRLKKLEATVFVGNEASRRAFEKNGFTLEGTIRRAVRKRGVLVDEWLFGILGDEPRGVE